VTSCPDAAATAFLFTVPPSQQQRGAKKNRNKRLLSLGIVGRTASIPLAKGCPEEDFDMPYSC
jgi:hypothetical protein